MARRSNEVQAAARAAREPDVDTLRWRALQDARGQILREGCTYRGRGAVIPWQVRRAVHGRTNQVEIVVSGRVWRRCSIRLAGRLMRQASTHNRLDT